MRKTKIYGFYACFILILFGNKGIGQAVDSLQTVLRSYQTVRLSTVKPKIDGKLDDACWETGEWSGDFIQWIPDEGGKPSQDTHLKILYDDQNVYIAIRAFDTEPDRIEKRMGRRDEIIGDVAGVCFDSYHDKRTGFEFDVTAGGQKIDLVLTNPWDADFNWNAVWYGKSGMEDSAWTVEMQIPLSQLRYSNEEEQVWGLHCWRWINRLREEDDWEPQSLTSPGMLYLFGEMKGIQGLKKSRRIELQPYVLGQINTYKKEAENPYTRSGHSASGNFGLNAKFGLSSNFTMDLAINPDFGQVEADPSVMNLSAFEVFYEEKRPLFLEGKSIFDFELEDASIFYSRRIGQTPTYHPDTSDDEYLDMPDNTTILSAVKLSGKNSKGLSVGILQSLTQKEQGFIYSDLTDSEKKIFVEPFTNYLVARVQQDYNKGTTTFGGILTSTNRSIQDPELNFMTDDAITGGFDLFHQWKDKEFFLDAKVIGSHVKGSAESISELQQSSARFYQRPDADYLTLDSTRTSLSGLGGKVKIGKGSKGLWRYSAEVNWRTPGLELNDMGFMQIADIIDQRNSVSYFVNKPTEKFRTYRINFSQYNNWNFNFDHLFSGADLEVYFELLNNWSLSVGSAYTSEKLDTRILRGGSSLLVPSDWSGGSTLSSDQSKRVYFSLNYGYLYLANDSRDHWSFGPQITVIPFDALRLAAQFDYIYNRDELQYVDEVEDITGPKSILGEIDQKTFQLTFRADFNINPEISLQYYGSPFASIGRFSDFKYVVSSDAEKYTDRFRVIDPVSNGDIYEVDENGDSQIDYSFDNPDFDFYQFRSNMVFRWEFKPGSQIFLVWSNERTNFVNPGTSGLTDTGKRLSEAFPNNIFLIKLNYWFSI